MPVSPFQEPSDRHRYFAVPVEFTSPGNSSGQAARAVAPRGVGGQHCQPSNRQSHEAVSLSPASNSARCSHSRSAFSWANTRSVREQCTLVLHQSSRHADRSSVTDTWEHPVIVRNRVVQPEAGRSSDAAAAAATAFARSVRPACFFFFLLLSFSLFGIFSGSSEMTGYVIGRMAAECPQGARQGRRKDHMAPIATGPAARRPTSGHVQTAQWSGAGRFLCRVLVDVVAPIHWSSSARK